MLFMQVRVMKRNVAHQMPEEMRSASQHVAQLEKAKRMLEDKVRQLETDGAQDDRSGLTLREAVVRVSELSVENQMLQEKAARLQADKESEERKHQAERRLLAQRGKSLFEDKVQGSGFRVQGARFRV